ncbi:hypothetical protein QAD02_005663 [Eretmocerus hayati]|uniref:Uncharacterized protein n=1 Tax=Eretmocerus hayati TaxID=131215 RepID=A0ACC2NU79_9HYME|nr:hypothetical protein QAD02_005663 [Eretmocerus hayati]
MGSDTDGTNCDIADVISLPSTPESSDQEETDSRPANFTIDIADEAEEETTNPAVDERVRSVRLFASPRERTTPPSKSPAVNRESPSLLSPIFQHFSRRRGSVDDVYLSSSSISAADHDENAVGILRSRPSGRLASVLARDFCEPAAAAWNAIGQRDAAWPESLSVRNEGLHGGNGVTTGESSVQTRSPGERNPNTERASGFDIHELQNSLPTETPSIPCAQPHQNSNSQTQCPSQEDQPSDIATVSSRIRDPSTQTGGGASSDASHPTSDGVGGGNESNNLQLRPAGVRFIVQDAGPRYIRSMTSP